MSTIFTLGYARWSIDEVEEELRAQSAILVDVRYSPRTSKPGFSKTDLQSRFGNRYVHVQALGNTQYKEGGVELARPDRGIEIVSALDRAPILMCGCQHPDSCHRTVAAQLLAQETGADIEHLRAPSERAEPGLFDSTNE